MKKLSAIFAAFAVLCIPALASAHVVVTPSQAGIGQELTFSVSVPNERETAMTSLRLDIPAGITNVTPTTKDGWTITASGSSDNVTAIDWTDGSIPVGQRQDFSFSAQAPGKTTDVDWKAYQTYADGTVVHWDQKPAGSDDATGNAGPYSVTHIVNDLNGSTATSAASGKANLTGPYVLSILALVFAVLAFSATRKQPR